MRAVEQKTEVYDKTTTNTTFLEVSKELEKRGLSNYQFMLGLQHPELVGIDPRDPGLTDELKQAVITEMVQNPWYYFREIAKLDLTTSACLQLWAAIHGIDSERQTVPTDFSVGVFFAWKLLSSDNPLLILSETGKTAEEYGKKIFELVMRTKPDRTEGVCTTDYPRWIRYRTTGGTVELHPCEKICSVSTAASFARGLTFNTIWYDNLFDHPYFNDIVIDSRVTRSRAKDISKTSCEIFTYHTEDANYFQNKGYHITYEYLPDFSEDKLNNIRQEKFIWSI